MSYYDVSNNCCSFCFSDNFVVKLVRTLCKERSQLLVDLVEESLDLNGKIY